MDSEQTADNTAETVRRIACEAGSYLRYGAIATLSPGKLREEAEFDWQGWTEGNPEHDTPELAAIWAEAYERGYLTEIRDRRTAPANTEPDTTEAGQ